MPSYKRRYSGSTSKYQPSRKRRNMRKGLAPQYRGFTPRQFSRGEWKFVDTQIPGVAMTNAARLDLLNGLQPGTSASQRIGMKVTCKSLEFKFFCRPNGASTAIQWNRVIIFIDRQANGVGPGASTDVVMFQDAVSPRNLANRKRFKIIYDKSFFIDPATTNNAGTISRMFKGYIKFRRPLVTEYNTGVAGTVADISTNALYLIQWGESAAGPQNSQFNGFFRVRYVDM